MVLVIVQIRSRIKILKPWYGCVVFDHSTLADLFQAYSTGELDKSTGIQQEYLNTSFTCCIGKSKQELVMVSCEVTVGEAVCNIVQYIDFNVSRVHDEIASSSFSMNAFSVLMQCSRERISLPNKWKEGNAKLKLKNDIIDWLQSHKLGWEPAVTTLREGILPT